MVVPYKPYKKKKLGRKHLKGQEYQECSVRVDGKVKRIRIGWLTNQDYQSLLVTIGDLESAKATNRPMGEDLENRVRVLDAKIQEKLCKVGLIREIKESKQTLGELVKDFIEFKLKTILPRSVRNYRSALNQIVEYFGEEARIASIEVGSVRKFVAEMRATKEKSTIGNYLKRGSEAFKYAIDNNWIKKNPFTGLPKGERCSIKLSTMKKKEQDEILTPQMVEKIVSMKKSKSDPLQDLEWDVVVALTRHLGLRIGEATILLWKDVDFEAEEVTIRGKRDSKNPGSSEMRCRTTPLWPKARPFLEALKAMSPGKEYVLNSIGNLSRKPEFEITAEDASVIKSGRYETNLDEPFKDILIRNGIPLYPQGFHGLRRYRINELRREGFSDIEITAYIGNDKATREGFYDNVSKLDRQSALKRARELLNQEKNGGQREYAAFGQNESDEVEKEVAPIVLGTNSPAMTYSDSSQCNSAFPPIQLSGVLDTAVLPGLCKEILRRSIRGGCSPSRVLQIFVAAMQELEDESQVKPRVFE